MQPDWEIWLDCHLSPIIAKWLNDDLGLNIKSAYSLQLYELDDYAIYEKAKAIGNVIIISKDSDLKKIITLKGSPPKLINIKTGNCDNKVLYNLLKNTMPQAVRVLKDFSAKKIIEIRK